MNAKLCKRLRKEAKKLNPTNSRDSYKELKRLAQELKHGKSQYSKPDTI